VNYEDQSHRFVITGQDLDGRPRTICECRCGAPGWECSRLGAGNSV
jgi:hypothetical protein